MSQNQQQRAAITQMSDVFWKCPFCREDLIYKGLQFPTLKQLKEDHARACERYAKWIDANINEEEEKQKLRLDGQQMMAAQIRFALYTISYDIARLKRNLADPSISEAEKEFLIRRKLDRAESTLENHTNEMRKLVSDKNEFI